MHTGAQIEIRGNKTKQNKGQRGQRQVAGEATGQVEAHLLGDRVPRRGGGGATPDSLTQLPATATQLGRNQDPPSLRPKTQKPSGARNATRGGPISLGRGR